MNAAKFNPASARARQINGLIVWLAGGMLLLGGIWLGVQTYTAVTEIRHTQVNTKSTLYAIRDCTQPKGRCYRDGQQRTAAAVGDIGQLSVYAAACAADPATDAPTTGERAHRIEACVKRLVAQSAPPPQHDR